MANATACPTLPATDTSACSRCDVLLGLPGVHVETVDRGPDLLT